MKAVIRGEGAKSIYLIDGKEVTQAEFKRRVPAAPPSRGRQGDSLVGWQPLHSEALAVHPKQIGEARADSEKKGVPTDFDKAGCPIFRTRKHRAAYLKAYGYFDKDAGYGDPTHGSTVLRGARAPMAALDDQPLDMNMAELQEQILQEFEQCRR